MKNPIRLFLVPQRLQSAYIFIFSMHGAVMELRACIAILFSFQRRPLYDERFVRDTRDWLCRLVAILLRVGNWQDHMFVLNHVLR